MTSRKNETVRRARLLGADRDARRIAGEFVCDGEKLLREALRSGAEVTSVFWAGEPALDVPDAAQYRVPGELLDYVSPLKSAAKVLFTVKIKPWEPAPPGKAVVLETLQDPGNLGTVLRTADALGVDTVILTGDCADPYGPKAVRATMGAIFRQRFYEMGRGELKSYLTSHNVRLCGAALSPEASDIREADFANAAVAIGSEGRGLTDELLSMCSERLIIPMAAHCESLNAAVAAAIVMWEMAR